MRLTRTTTDSPLHTVPHGSEARTLCGAQRTAQNRPRPEPPDRSRRAGEIDLPILPAPAHSFDALDTLLAVMVTKSRHFSQRSRDVTLTTVRLSGVAVAVSISKIVG